MKTFYVALNNIRSLYNVGSLFRTADAFGVQKILLGGYTGTPTRKEITKTALGAERWIPYETVWRLPQKLVELKKEGFQCVGLENNKKGAIPLQNFSPSFPLVLVVGNEVKGLSKRVMRRLDEVVYIPMTGKKESLNVAVAFGIAAFYIRMKSETRNLKLNHES